MRRFRKYRKPNYSRPTKLILIAVLVLLTAVLGYIIMLEARQIKLERAGQLPAQQTAQPVQTRREYARHGRLRHQRRGRKRR